MKVGPHVMTHSHSNQNHEREIVPRVGSAQAGGNLKLIQCQLMLLLHARRCQQRQELIITRNNSQQPSVTDSMARAILLNCPIRHCRAMKEVLNHMKTCRLGGTCTYQHCTTSLRILSHWTNCTIEDCPLCQCVRQRMRRAKEWEATLPRSSRYTLLAAALRSSQTPRPVPPNCNMAEQAQEGQSGVPCQNQEDLRSQNRDNQQQAQQNESFQVHGQSQQHERSNPCDKSSCDKSKSGGEKHSIPSFDQVRKAYEQLGIPCPEEALKRLMATLPTSNAQNNDGQGQPITETRMDTSGGGGDQGVFDCSSAEPSPSSSSTLNSQSDPNRNSNQQHPVISSTTTSTIPFRLPFKSSMFSRPK